MSLEFYAAISTACSVLIAAVFFGVALLIFWRRSNERMALYAAFFLVLLGALVSNVETLGQARPMLWLPVTLVGYLAWACFVPLFYLFPDGRFVPRWMRWLVPFWVVVELPYWFFPDSSWVNSWPPLLGGMIFFGFLGSAVAAQVYRYIYVSSQEQRQQTKWVIFGVVIALVTVFGSQTLLSIFFAGYDGLANQFIGILFLPIPVSIGIAVLRHRLWDIDPIVNRTLVYSALTASIVGVYVLVVGYLGAVFRVEDNLLISLVAAALVAVLFQPLREWLQRSVNRLMYGERDEPYRVISRLGERLEATLAPDAVLPAIVGTIREALKLPYAAIALPRDESFEVAASSGEPVDDTIHVPLTYQGSTVGELLLGPRAPGEEFSATDRRLLEDLAHHAGVAVHGVRVMADLRRSRERLVLAREEERRRLRRDLHDELAPTLAALGLSAATVGELIESDPKQATAANEKLRAALRDTVGDVRRLAYDLRPPALDDLGLVEAVEERAARFGPESRVTVEATGLPETLPAAVEVAAYLIVQEALMNVSRHAGASTCNIRLACPGSRALEVEVTDDGIGLPDAPGQGVGLRSMRERAAELGGSCEIGRSSSSGARVFARLPLAEDHTHEGTE
jgi:signal transduction histidine kinase